MHRVNIVYASRTDRSFDWQHYLNTHLPIACGVSSRHAPIIRCDVDRPIELGATVNVGNDELLNDAIVAICTVYFSSLENQNNFRQFFASGHPDSEQILADEPNYTTIQPSFNAGLFKASDSTEANTKYRVKFLFPRQEKPVHADELDTVVDTLVTELEGQGIRISSNEIDNCQSDVPADTASVYEWMVGLNVEDKQSLAGIAHCLNATQPGNQNLAEKLGINPRVIFSEVINFNLALCEPYLRPSIDN